MNIKPAPFAFTPGAIAAALGESPEAAARVVHVPVLPIRLVDRPRRSEDPRLARANDDGGPA